MHAQLVSIVRKEAVKKSHVLLASTIPSKGVCIPTIAFLALSIILQKMKGAPTVEFVVAPANQRAIQQHAHAWDRIAPTKRKPNRALAFLIMNTVQQSTRSRWLAMKMGAQTALPFSTRRALAFRVSKVLPRKISPHLLMLLCPTTLC